MLGLSLRDEGVTLEKVFGLNPTVRFLVPDQREILRFQPFQNVE